MATLRLATWNLLHGLALPSRDVRRADLLESAKRLDADILAVQEADVGQPRSGYVDQVAELAAALDAPWYLMLPTMVGEAESGWRAADPRADLATGVGNRALYGIGLISRFEVLRWSFRLFRPSRLGAPLLIPGEGFRHVPDEQRGAIAAEVVGPEGVFTAMAAHLSFIPSSSTRQLRAVTGSVAGFPGPHVLLGDLNLPGNVPHRVSGWRPLVRGHSYPSWRPRVQWDHVLSDGISTHQVIATQQHALGVSDHCAVTVDVTL